MKKEDVTIEHPLFLIFYNTIGIEYNLGEA